MSTQIDLTHVEVPTKLHSVLKTISKKTGIKIKHLAKELILEGLHADSSAVMVARSGVEKEAEEMQDE